MELNDGIVTIGVPVYNEENFLHETLSSLVNQTYKKIKIVVSDNCSEDTTVKIAEEFMNKYSNVKLIEQNENIGATLNFKFLAEIADTEFFMWMGAHDIISPEYVENSVKLLNENKGAVLVYHKAAYFTDHIEDLGEENYSKIDTSSMSKSGRLRKIINVLGACTAIHGVFRASAAKKIPFVKMVGPDHLMLFAAADLGHILQIDRVGFFRRHTHMNETIDQRRKRYHTYKMYTKKGFSDTAKFAREHIRYLMKINDLSFFSKLWVMLNIVFRVTVNFVLLEILHRKRKH